MSKLGAYGIGAGSYARPRRPGEFEIFWNERAQTGYAVYLMSRGRNWRIGQTMMVYAGGVFGPRLRMNTEKADCIWILEIEDSRSDAIEREQTLAWLYGVPDVTFVSQPPARLDQQQLDRFWATVESEAGAKQLLEDRGRKQDSPLLRRNQPVAEPEIRCVIDRSSFMPTFMRRAVECTTK